MENELLGIIAIVVTALTIFGMKIRST